AVARKKKRAKVVKLRPDETASGLSRCRQLPPHCLDCLALYLTNTLGRDTVLVGELLQRRRIFFLQPTRPDDATASVVEPGHCALQSDAAVTLGLGALEYLNRFVLGIGQVQIGRA